MKTTRTIVLFVILAGAVSFGFIWEKDTGKEIIGGFFFERLQKADLSKCISGEKGFAKVKSCLDNIGYTYVTLGDTIDGNFKIVISKPYAEAYVEAKRWKFNGSGAGIRESFASNDCYIEQNSPEPILSDKEKALLRDYIGSWYKINPEASSRFITGVVDSGKFIQINSLPLEEIKDYTMYCPDFVVMKYLDDRPNLDLDETEIRKITE